MMISDSDAASALAARAGRDLGGWSCTAGQLCRVALGGATRVKFPGSSDQQQTAFEIWNDINLSFIMYDIDLGFINLVKLSLAELGIPHADKYRIG